MNRITFILFFAILISSCEKPETVENVKELIRYTYIGNANKKLEEEFKYQNNGNLKEKIEYVENSVYRIYFYKFNDNEKLEYIKGYNSDTVLISETSFEFNGSGLLKKEIYFNSLYQQQFGYNGYGLFEYYENNFLKKASYYNKYDELLHYYTFEDYDDNGNYRTRKVFDNNSEEAKFVIKFKYSNALNPFHIYKHPWYSNYNMESSLSGWGLSDYMADYETNDLGYPTKRELTYTNGNQTGYLYYEYY